MDNKVREEYNGLLDQLDRYIFLMELSVMIESQGSMVYMFRCKNNDDFMVAIEYLMNYLNSIYTLREYAKGFDNNDKVCKIQNEYYKNNIWYLFVADYRDCAVHDFALPRYYNQYDGQLVIQVDEVIRRQEKIQNSGKYNKYVDKRIDRLKRFKEDVTEQFPASYFAEMTCKAVLDMAKEMLEAEYDQCTENALIKLIHLANSHNDSEVSLSVENFYINAYKKWDHEGCLFKKIHRTFIENNYTEFRHYHFPGLKQNDIL